MEILGLVALGLLLGVVLCLLAFAAYLLYRAAGDVKRLTTEYGVEYAKTMVANSAEIRELRLELTAALTKIDAGRMHEASLLIQRTQRQFARTTEQFMKLLYSQEGAAQIAAEEAQESAEAAEDARYTGINPNAYLDHLRQRDAERKAAEILASQLSHTPPLDPDQAWRLQEEEDLAGGPLA